MAVVHFRVARTGGGAVERAGLENRYGLRVIVGSNPTLSALKLSIPAMSIAAGIFWAATVTVTGLLGMWFDGYAAGFLGAVASVYPGFDADGTLTDLLIGSVHSLVDGAIAGALVALLYNMALSLLRRP